MFDNLFNALGLTFQSFWQEVSYILPNIFLAFLVCVLGVLLAKVAQEVVEKVVRVVGFDNFLVKIKLKDFFKKAGYNLNSGKFLGGIFFWLIIIAFVIIILDILNLDEIRNFLTFAFSVVLKIFLALMICIMAVFIGRFTKNMTIASAKTFDVENEELLGNSAKWVIYFLALVTVLDLFGVFSLILNYITIIVAGLVFALSLAFGLAFGLGGKEYAKKFLERYDKK